YVAWIQIRGDTIDATDPVTGDLKQINFATAGAIESIAETGTTILPLVTTTPQSMRIADERFVGLPDVVALFRDFNSQNKPEVLAARVMGIANSAFPDGPPEG